MSLGDELVLRARAEAQQYRTVAASAVALDALRAEAAELFEALPEPPAYRRANDPARDRARELLPRAGQLLSRLLAAAAQRDEDGHWAVLVRAVEANLRALVAISEGQIAEGDDLSHEAWEAARAASKSGSFFQLEGAGATVGIFDPETGVSRYDPRPEPSLTVQLFCANEDCRRPAAYSVSPRYATHRFSCTLCGKPFTGHFVEIRGMESRSVGKAMHYALHVEEVGGGATVLEFDDASQGEIAVSPRDLAVLLYSGTGTLSAVENLTTGHVLWIVPKGACFVATVAFGPAAPELDDFRAFRDRVLLRSDVGRAVVRAYYRHGPWLAGQLARRPAARSTVRWFLRRVHGAIVDRRP